MLLLENIKMQAAPEIPPGKVTACVVAGAALNATARFFVT